MSGISPDYVEVADRIVEFYEKHPEGSLQGTATPMLKAETLVGWIYKAFAYRTPGDPVPAVGYAWEPVPGLTNFTRGSELMNAETSAWGRAIVAAGIKSKRVASANEVRNRQTDSVQSTTHTQSIQPPTAATNIDGCPECGATLRFVKAGEKDGKPYPAFVSCTAKCGWRPPRENPTMGLVALDG